MILLIKCTFIFLSIYRSNKDEMPLIERVNLTKVWGPKDKSLKIPDKGTNLLQRVNSNWRTKMLVSKSILVVALILVSHSMAIKISSDGGYTDIVIKIKDQVPEDKCPQILQNLKVGNFGHLNFTLWPFDLKGLRWRIDVDWLRYSTLDPSIFLQTFFG